MDKIFKNILFISLLLFLLISLLIGYSLFSGTTSQVNEYFGLKSYPKAELTETEKNSEDGSIVKVTFHSKDEVPQISKWYMDSISKTDWEVDIPPADISDSDVQLIMLRNDDKFLSISLVSDENNETNIIFEPSSVARQQEGEEDE